jgi:hypothetical protein
MATDLFESLAELEIPPPPDTEAFDRQLHERVNRSLVAGQMTDLVIGGLPWAIAHFARALVGLITLTITGRYDSKGKDARR